MFTKSRSITAVESNFIVYCSTYHTVEKRTTKIIETGQDQNKKIIKTRQSGK